MALELKLDLENLSPIKKKLLLILPPLLIALLFLVNFILPSYEERSKLASEVEKQRQDIELARQKTVRLPVLIAENQRLKKRLIELENQLPQEKEVTPLLGQVSNLAINTKMDVVLWKPKERLVHPSKEVYEIPVDVEIRGNYHQLGRLFSDLTKLSRIVNVNSLSVKPADVKYQRKNNIILQTSFVIKTYSIISEEEKKELEKLEKEKKK
jgi:type IV pilus assembly protein PilO